MAQLDYAPAGSQEVAARSFSRFGRVMTLAFMSYGLAYLDRVNYSSAEAGGMSKSLHLSANMAALLPAMFFIGYCIFQIPAARLASRRNVKWMIFWALVAWGVLSGLTGIVRSVPVLIVVRLLLGAVEGVVLPAMLVFLTRWFTKSERSRSNSLLILTNPVVMAFMLLGSGFVIAAFDRHNIFGLAGWQWMFVVEGLPSIIWAFAWAFLAVERPTEASWLSAEESADVQRVLDGEQREMEHISSFWAACRDSRVIRLVLMYFFFSSAAYGFSFWLPTIVKEGTARGIAGIGVLSSLPYFLAILTMIGVSYLSDRMLLRKPFVWGSMFLGCISLIGSYLAGPQHFWLAFMGLMVVGSCIYCFCGPLWAWIGDMLPRNVVGESMALVNTGGSAGGFVGTYLVGALIKMTGSTGAGFVYMAFAFLAAGVLALSVQSRRTRVQPVGFPVGAVEGGALGADQAVSSPAP